jgi:hypothetical protein
MSFEGTRIRETFEKRNILEFCHIDDILEVFSLTFGLSVFVPFM